MTIDELSALLGTGNNAADTVFANELDQFLNVIARNYGVWVQVCSQERFQMNERMQKTLMTLGTQVLGRTDAPDSAFTSAKHFFRFDPNLVSLFDLRTVPPMEQFLVHSEKFLDQKVFHFLVRPAAREGSVRSDIFPVSIANYAYSQYPISEELVAMAREKLMAKCGISVAKLLADIETRQREFGFDGMLRD